MLLACGALTAGALTGVGAAALPAAAAAPATAPPPPVTFTWSGADAAAGGSNHWSDPGNWAGAVAPAAGSKVALVFPALGCQATTSCGKTDNDVSGLIVKSLAISGGTSGREASVPDYVLSGHGISLGGDISVRGNVNKAAPAVVTDDLALTLARAESWTFDEAQFNIVAPVTGTFGLNLELADSSSVNLTARLRDSTITVVGANRSLTGTRANANGAFYVGPSGTIDSGTGKTNFHDVYTTLAGTIGPVDEDGAVSQLLTGADTSITGALTLKSSDQISDLGLTPGNGTPQHPQDYSQLNATGAINLGSATLLLSASCSQPIGTTYQLVRSSPGHVHGTFDYDGAPIKNGAVLQATSDGDANCDGSASGPSFTITYDTKAGTVTAVAVTSG